MSEVAHQCYYCPKILKFDDYCERHYYFHVENGVEIRTIYFYVCQDCAKGEHERTKGTQSSG